MWATLGWVTTSRRMRGTRSMSTRFSTSTSSVSRSPSSSPSGSLSHLWPRLVSTLLLKFIQRSIEGGTLFGSVRSKESVNMWKGKSTCLGTKYWRSLKNENGTMIAYPCMWLTLTFHCIKVYSAGKLWPKCRDDNQVEVSLWWTPEMSTAYNRNSGWSGASHPQFSLFTKDILAPLAPRS